MGLADLYSRAPYRIRPGTRATVEDRDGETVALFIEPLNDPAVRTLRAEAAARMFNAAAQAEPSALPVAAE